MTYRPISDYGVIGDMRSAALMSSRGSIDWLCLPDLDSPSVFASLLDINRGGHWSLAPAGEFTSQQTYVEDTNVLSTVFETSTGNVELIDLMPLGDDGGLPDCRVLRIVRGRAGKVDMRCEFVPRLSYARGETRFNAVDGGAIASNGDFSVALSSPVPLRLESASAKGDFEISEGESLAFALSLADGTQPQAVVDSERLLRSTTQGWHDIAATIDYDGRWRDEVRRSVLALHLLVYRPSGALAAAATTSLPEWIGGSRNWDYRFCWVRDAAYAFDVLDRLGHKAETQRFLLWLGRHLSRGRTPQTLYGLKFHEQLDEAELPNLEGYGKSHPVRIGNDAHRQRQLDVYGDAMLAYTSYHRAGGEIGDELWSAIEQLADGAAAGWRLPDCGIWEVRGPMRHFVHSKVMCWMAVNNAIALGQALHRPEKIDAWIQTREEIREDVLRRGWNESAQSFVQFYGADHADASLLMIPFVGFLPPDDPRVRSTMERIRADLEDNGFLRRYRTEHVDDGIGSDEGAFVMCTLWLAGYLTSVGELDEAEAILERVLKTASPLGLFSEMVNPQTGELLGNYPQAFTHLSFIHTAKNLDAALTHGHAASETEEPCC